jgi:hypothetical protein
MQWVDAEVNALLDYLIEHKGEAGDGMNFKTATYRAALPHVAPHHVKGPVKTASMLKTKYNLVRQHFRHLERKKAD